MHDNIFRVPSLLALVFIQKTFLVTYNNIALSLYHIVLYQPPITLFAQAGFGGTLVRLW